ncbi:hypothetical protein Pyn_29582 [Prunus yedoensis var. nudiflora]|uniref:Uncharacterized protein n=1 Tax=Prunus yedoensis var. nudiflora TaxID=2094558 RepID=A0A314UAZ0_PRUYE|nr:hypothetical protein Pyn_29582 [Prunus yedoensis var. nudiflora]
MRCTKLGLGLAMGIKEWCNSRSQSIRLGQPYMPSNYNKPDQWQRFWKKFKMDKKRKVSVLALSHRRQLLTIRKHIRKISIEGWDGWSRITYPGVSQLVLLIHP